MSLRPWRGVEGLPREAWILFTTNLVNRLGTMALPFLVLYLTRHLGLSAGAAGGLLALYGATSLVADALHAAIPPARSPTPISRTRAPPKAASCQRGSNLRLKPGTSQERCCRSTKLGSPAGNADEEAPGVRTGSPDARNAARVSSMIWSGGSSHRVR